MSLLDIAVVATVVCVASLAAGFAARARVLRSAGDGLPAGSLAMAFSARWTSVGRSLAGTDRYILGLAIWLMLLDAALALAAPWPLKLVIDYGLGHHRFPPSLAGLNGFSPMGLAVFAAVIGLTLLSLGGLAGYLVTILLGACGERMTSRLRVGVIDHVLRATPRAVSGLPLGELVSRIGSDAGRVADTVAAAIETLVPDLAVLAGMTAITAALDWRLTLIALGVIPLYAVTARQRNRRLRGAQQDARARAGELSAVSADLLARTPAVHVFGRADTEVSAFRSASAAAASATARALDAGARFSPVTGSLPGVGLAAALIGGTAEVSAGRLTIGGLLVFLAYLSSLTAPVRSLSQLSATVTRGRVSRDRVAELLSIPLVAGQHPQRVRSREEKLQVPAGRRRGAALSVSAVSYAHEPGLPILDLVSLGVRAGEFVCLTGPSGAGKSTLLALLVRLAEPDSGVIDVDGRDIASLPLHQLRRLITLVPQDPWLHRGSIAANIGYGNPLATAAQIEAAAEIAGVTEFTWQLPGGLATSVGEQGRTLSGGQQRRIAVARALAADTPILLLDEPTSGLDAATEDRLIGRLLDSARGRTIIMVTHSGRLATLADRVVALDRGRLGSDVAAPWAPTPIRAECTTTA